MGGQIPWFVVIVACQLSAVYSLSIASTDSTDNVTKSTVHITRDKLSGGTAMKYDPYDPYKDYRDTVNAYTTYMIYYLVGVGVFVVGSLFLGAILYFMNRPVPKQGFVVNSNGAPQQPGQNAQPPSYQPGRTQGYVVNSNAAGQQGQNAPTQKVQPPSHPGVKQGYVVNSNAAGQNVQQAQNPTYQPMYPEVKSVQQGKY